MTWEGLSPPYSTIVVDPPWPYEERVISYERGVGHRVLKSMPYAILSVPEIAELPVVDLARPSAHLYLWTTNRFLWASRDVCLGWGFEPVQVLAWCKPPSGQTPSGGAFASSLEFIIHARRSIKAKRQTERAGNTIREARESAGLNRAELHRVVRGGTPTGIVHRWEDDECLPNEQDWVRLQNVLPLLQGVDRPYVEPPPSIERTRIDRSWWQWPRGLHSEKPPGFLDVVEQVSPGPYVELFARQPRLGWDSWGHGFEATA